MNYSSVTKPDCSLYPEHLGRALEICAGALEATGKDRLLIHSGVTEMYFLDDRPVPFKANPHYRWLVPAAAQQCGILIEPGSKPVLFLHRPEDFWHAAPEPPADWWAAHFDIRPQPDGAAWLERVTDDRNLAVIGAAPELQQRFRLAALNPAAMLHELHMARTVKSDWETDCLRAASARAVRAHLAVAKALQPDVSEFKLHLIYQQAAEQGELELPYDNIIALNRHAAVLHFTALNKQPPANLQSLLIDAGAQAYGYAADITRSYSIEAPSLYAELIAAVDAMQQQLVEAVMPGVDYRDLHLQAHRRIAGILQRLDIVRADIDTQIETGITSAFFPHGLGHFLGLQVHDVGGLVERAGNAVPRPEGHPFLRLTRKLEAGNVLTVEPGIYFIDQLLAPLQAQHAGQLNNSAIDALRPCGGVRIEDDVLVTEDRPVNLTREAFARLAGR